MKEPEATAPEPVAFQFGENLVRIRKARKFTHRSLAEAAGVSPSWVSNLESGKIADPGVYLVYRLALVLAVPMEELMGVSRLSGRTRLRRRQRLTNSPENADTIGDDNSMPGDAGE